MKNLINKQERIFIAGAKGMVGSSIYRALKKAGYGNLSLKGKLLTPSKQELDLSNIENVKKWFEINKPTIVILAAAKVGGIIANTNFPFEFILENLKIETNVIETSWKFGVKRLLFLGSSCIYPKYCEQPIKEEYLLSNYLEPTNESYAIAKIAGLKLCSALRQQYCFDAFSLMPTNLYGPGDNYHPENSHVMASLIRKFSLAVNNNEKQVICWGTGLPKREFLHVDDLGSAVVFTLEFWDPSNSPILKNDNSENISFLNIGTGKDISIKDLAIKIAQESNFNGEIIWDTSKPDGTPQKLLDISKINNLGWEPKITLNNGIKRTIHEYKQLII